MLTLQSVCYELLVEHLQYWTELRCVWALTVLTRITLQAGGSVGSVLVRDFHLAVSLRHSEQYQHARVDRSDGLALTFGVNPV